MAVSGWRLAVGGWEMLICIEVGAAPSAALVASGRAVIAMTAGWLVLTDGSESRPYLKDIAAAAGRPKVGARFIVHSFTKGAAKPRPYPQQPCGGWAQKKDSTWCCP